jgi:hypothetical protein
MLICKNKIFSKFLFFSLVFLLVSFIANSVIAFSVSSPEKKEVQSRKKAIERQVQQREILDYLERIENKIVIFDKRL